MTDPNISPTLTPKEHTFALAYVESGNATEAYRRAFTVDRMNEATMRREAHSIVHRPRVAEAIKSLQAEHLARHCVTVDRLTKELEWARREALTQGQASAAVAATMGKAKLFGLVVENKAITRGEGIIFRMKLGAPA